MPQAKREPKLSKSRYLSGLQCHLKLWYECYDRALAGPIDAATQAIFDIGHEVGELATKRHPGGILIEADHFHHEQAVEKTKAVMADAKVPAIFEASFMHGDVRTRADILIRLRGGKWDLIEVKSASKVKDVNVDDLAVQHWVMSGAGLDIRNAGVLVLNTAYVYDGKSYDVDELFTLHDLSDTVPGMAKDVARNVKSLHEMLAGPRAPRIEPGDQCFDPYECPYYEHCTKGMKFPKHPFDELPGLHPTKREALKSLGAEAIKDVPADFPMTALQKRVRESVLAKKEYVSKDLSKVLAEPEYPIHHLDFETFMLALPRYKGTRPYQTIPFQWSNHIERAGGKLRHDEYLCCEDKDPRPEFVESMLESLGTQGTIVIYTPYEIRVIRELATAYPKYAKRLAAVEQRCWDLCAVTRDNYYHPDFHGSFSLKKVLPVLVPSMSYDNLAVQEGQQAAREYLEALQTDDPKRRKQIHEALLEYCGQDTEAMVQLRRHLVERVADGHGLANVQGDAGR
jgi:hypothetical protein